MSRSTWRFVSPAIRRAFFSWSRTLHIYISTALFTLLVFFCVSGFTLNHGEWFTGSVSDQVQLSLPEELANTLAVVEAESPWPSGMDELQAFIRSELGLDNPRTVTSDRELAEIELDYPLPAGYAYVVVDVGQHEILVEFEKGNVWALMNDLHKGRHTGVFWSWVIDVSAALMLLFALTGLFILFQLRKRRQLGLWSVVIGTLTPIVLYWFLVPSINLPF